MPKMIVSIDEVVIKDVQITKDRTTVGRRPYNDVVIDNLAVSGEHAAIVMSGGEVSIEDLNSTNGTYVNGKSVKKQALKNGDQIEIGKYKIRYVGDSTNDQYDKTMIVRSASHLAATPGVAPSAPAAAPSAPPSPVAQGPASIKVLSGAAAGREVPLSKVVTTIGKPGVAVAAITKRQQGFVVHHVEGGGNPTLNGMPISSDPVGLKNGDVIELAGTKMQFVQA